MSSPHRVWWIFKLSVSLAATAVAIALLAGNALSGECTGGNLPEGMDQDLVVTGTCVVVPSAKPYQYGVVNIINGGSLQFTDGGKTDFWAKSILVEKDSSLIAGVQGFGTSQETIVPIGTNGGKLTIHLYGAYDKAKTGIECKTTPTKQCGIPDSGPKKAWDTNKPFKNGELCNTTTLPGG
ncbi:MAG: hypothetical protein WBE78_02325, partial [Candidatus Binataceae bacterium]